MRTAFFLSIFLLFATTTLLAQPKKTAFDDYYDKGKVFIVVKCLEVGAMNILLRAHVQVEVLHVIKGQETRRRMSIDSQYGMQPGEYYLLRSTDEPNEKENYFRTNDRNSVIRIVSESEVETLPTLDPRIAVRRTMNLRAAEVESKILVLTYEKEALDSARKDY